LLDNVPGLKILKLLHKSCDVAKSKSEVGSLVNALENFEFLLGCLFGITSYLQLIW